MQLVASINSAAPCLTRRRRHKLLLQAEASDEPLKLSQVVIPPEVEAQVERVWRGQRCASVYKSAAEAVALIREVLSRDIRSLNQRLYIHPVGAKAGGGGGEEEAAAASSSEAGGGGDSGGSGGDGERGRYIVVLDSMDVTYDLTSDGTVLLRGVYPLGGGVDGGEALAAEAATAAAARRQQAGVA